MPQISIEVSEKEIRLQDPERPFQADPGFGATNLFYGMVRDWNQGKKVEAVAYDAFVPLAKRVLQEIAEEARAQYCENASVWVQHRTGKLKVGEVSVLILVHTPHRDESFKICRYVIEELKKRAPIWKKEYYLDGETEWLKGHALCGHGHDHD